VEGDDARVTWKAIPALFTGFETDQDIGGSDGFLRLKRSAANTAALESLERIFSPNQVALP
jgi:hypothetical protein